MNRGSDLCGRLAGSLRSAANARGPAAQTVLLRGMGPSLAAFGVTESLPDPMLELIAGSDLLRENHGWRGDDSLASVGRSVNAFGFTSAYGQDAALLITLEPGTYTLQVSSQSGAAGVILAEIYEVP